MLSTICLLLGIGSLIAAPFTTGLSVVTAAAFFVSAYILNQFGV